MDVFSQVAEELAERIAEGIGATATKGIAAAPTAISPALSMMTKTKTAATRKVAVMLGTGYHTAEVQALLKELTAAKITAEIVSISLAPVKGNDGTIIEPQQSLLTAASVLYDAIYVSGGAQGVDELLSDIASAGFVREAFQHYKTIAAIGDGVRLLTAAGVVNAAEAQPIGVLLTGQESADSTFFKSFIDAIAQHRHWDRMLQPGALK